MSAASKRMNRPGRERGQTTLRGRRMQAQRILDFANGDSDAFGYELPDPPDNLDFLDLPEDFQDRVSERFDNGMYRRECADAQARAIYRWQVQTMRERRDRFSAAQAERKAAQRTRERANKASLGERAGTREALTEAYLAAHRADNSGSGK